MGDHSQAARQPLIGLSPQFLHLIIGKFRQNRIALIGFERAAAGDFDCILQGLRQIRKEHSHFCRGFEVMLWGEASSRTLLIHIRAFRNADQRIMGLVYFRLGEIHIVGGHQGQIHRIGHFNQATFAEPFSVGHTPILAGMTLQLHIKPISKGLCQTFK